MNEEKQILIAVSISLIILLSFFAITYQIPQPTPSVFPLWVSGENNELPNPEMNVSLGRQYSLIIGSQNNMHKSQACIVEVKLRNPSSLPPFSGNATINSKPASLPSILKYSFTLDNNQTWQTKFSFVFSGTTNFEQDRILIDSIVIDNKSYGVASEAFANINYTSDLQFLYELWLQDPNQNPYFSGVWVSSPFFKIGA